MRAHGRPISNPTPTNPFREEVEGDEMRDAQADGALSIMASGATCVQKLEWFTGFCNSHQVSHFAAFFIDARAEILRCPRVVLNWRHALFPGAHRNGASQRAGSVVEYSLCAFCARGFDNDPSAGSPTETLLRLLLPLNDKVQWTSRDVAGSKPPTSPRSEHFTGPFNR
ncbi:Uncharacterized protein Adt_49018 [Abeliophyllum distichum]|uniref:Uncharacterized protein n=1 Tax=Abeliophyllum distichum TaxID=126358 RepID=A0ABD1NPE6_9LAMI